MSDAYMSFIPNKSTFTGLRNPLTKAVTGTFHRPDGHSKRSCLQDRANFQRSLTLQIVLISETAM